MSNIDLNDFKIIGPPSDQENLIKVQSLRNNEEYALKTITRPDLKAHLRDIQGVLAILNCNHPNIVKILGYTIKQEKKDNKIEYKLFLLMKLFDKTLFSDISERKKNKNFYSKDEFLKIIQELNSALLYLQTAKQIAHRDIKPSNILISNENSLILTDFSEAFLQSQIKEKSTSVVGTPYFMAPEIKEIYIKQDFSNESSYNPWKSDVFSMGMTLLDCACLIFAEKDNLDAKIKFIENHYGKNVKEFIEICINPNESKRMDFVELNQSKIFLALDTRKNKDEEQTNNNKNGNISVFEGFKFAAKLIQNEKNEEKKKKIYEILNKIEKMEKENNEMNYVFGSSIDSENLEKNYQEINQAFPFSNLKKKEKN